MTKRKYNSDIPDGIKRPLNPFQCFIKATAKAYRAEGSGEKKTSREFGVMWRTELTEEEKQPYYDMAKEDRKRYESELASAGYKVKKRKSDKTLPSRPCPPFLFYTAKHYKRVMKENECSYHTSLKHLGETWKALSEEQKRPYMELAREDREKWLTQYRNKTEEIVESITST